MPKKTLSEIMIEVNANARAHGFWDGLNVCDPLVLTQKICLMHEELSEMFGEIRSGRDPLDVYTSNSNPNKPEGFPIELADLVIRAFDLSVQLGIDLEGMITLKHEYNKTRPYKHGRTC